MTLNTIRVKQDQYQLNKTKLNKNCIFNISGLNKTPADKTKKRRMDANITQKDTNKNNHPEKQHMSKSHKSLAFNTPHSPQQNNKNQQSFNEGKRVTHERKKFP